MKITILTEYGKTIIDNHSNRPFFLDIKYDKKIYPLKIQTDVNGKLIINKNDISGKRLKP